MRILAAAMGGLSRRERQIIAAILAATVVSGIAHYADWPALLAFAVATVALAGLAHLVSLATEQVGERFGPAATGVLQSTLGNLPEFFVVIFALRAGEVVVAQTSIVGSLLVNALLVLGLVIVVGARSSSDGVMRFGPRLPNDTATLLLVTVLHHRARRDRALTHEPAARHEREISTIAAAALLLVYLRGSSPTCAARRRRADARGRQRVPLGGLDRAAGRRRRRAGLRVGLVHRRAAPDDRPARRLGGLRRARRRRHRRQRGRERGRARARPKGQSDLAISVVKNSVAQVAAFLYPALVLVSLLFAHQLTFALAPVLIGALLLTALSMWQITGDGEASRSRAGPSWPST